MAKSLGRFPLGRNLGVRPGSDRGARMATAFEGAQPCMLHSTFDIDSVFFLLKVAQKG